MLESYFRRKNKAAILNKQNDAILADKDRLEAVHVIVDFMIEAFGEGDPNKITQQQKILTARATINLFVSLKGSETGKELVRSHTFSLLRYSFQCLLLFTSFCRTNCWEKVDFSPIV